MIERLAKWTEGYFGGHYYENSQLHNNQFVGRVPMDSDAFKEAIEALGFEPQPQAASSGEYSYRKVTGPDQQVHVLFYDGDEISPYGDRGYTYVYAHIEPRWDVNPLRSIRSTATDTAVRTMKNLLDENGVTYEPIRP